MQSRRVAKRRDSEETNFSLLTQALERRHHIVEHLPDTQRRSASALGDRIVQVEDIDPVETQSRQAAFERYSYRIGNAAEFAGRQPDLGADDHIGRFEVLQNAAKVLFRLAVAVLYRGVEIVDARAERTRDGTLLVGRIATYHDSANRTAAEAQHRELHSRASKSPQLHRRSSDGTETMQCRARVTQPGYFAGAMIGPPTALAFMMSRPYNFGKLGGSVDVDFLSQIRSHIGIGGDALSGRASGPCPSSCPSRPCVILDPRLAARLRESRHRQLEHLRQFSELRW